MLINFRPELARKNGEFVLLLSKGVVLKGGMNSVRSQDWQEVLKDDVKRSVVDELTAKGALAVAVQEDDTSATHTLSFARSIPEAIEIARTTQDLKLLEAWLATEDRRGVISALEAQIDLIKNPPLNDEAVERRAKRKREEANAV